MDQVVLIKDLEREEPEAVVRTIAIMSYIPVIGRVLERGGVDKFVDLMTAAVPQLGTISCRGDYDVFQAKTCERILYVLSTSKGERLSYSIYPDRPILLDSIWSRERKRAAFG